MPPEPHDPVRPAASARPSAAGTPPGLLSLRDAFRAEGRDLWIVGGHVRDRLRGLEPADLDLVTDASPAEQERVYGRHRIRRVPTGAAHGTYTAVVADVPYEVTSLRASGPGIRFGRDLAVDLGMRDLTVNAIAATFEGALVDPWGGARDLADRRVRFCGDPADRISEDPIRIMRWLRFHMDIAGHAPLDPAAAAAARAAAGALAGTARERVWKEVSRTLALPAGGRLPGILAELGLSAALGLPPGDEAAAEAAHARGGARPEVVLAAYLRHDEAALRALSGAWRWSRAERERAAYVARHVAGGAALDRLLYVERHAPAHVAELARATGREAELAGLLGRPAPTFPVRGRDLRRLGYEDGPGLGAALARLRDAWAEGGYAQGADDLLAGLPAVNAPGRSP